MYIIFLVLQVRVFGSLVKGLRIAMDLLMLLHKGGHIIPSLSKIFIFSIFDGSNGLDKFLTQFEAAVASDFPNYQVSFLLIYSAMEVFSLSFPLSVSHIFHVRILFLPC